jgi:hypothetical protein
MHLIPGNSTARVLGASLSQSSSAGRYYSER